MGLPRVDVVFRLWQCDKKNQGWREGPPLTVPCQSFDPLPGLHPPAKSVSTKKEYCFTSEDATPSIRNLAALKRPTGQSGSNGPCVGPSATPRLGCQRLDRREPVFHCVSALPANR
jgi:hypothetical protein